MCIVQKKRKRMVLHFAMQNGDINDLLFMVLRTIARSAITASPQLPLERIAFFLVIFDFNLFSIKDNFLTKFFLNSSAKYFFGLFPNMPLHFVGKICLFYKNAISRKKRAFWFHSAPRNWSSIHGGKHGFLQHHKNKRNTKKYEKTLKK